MSKEKLEIDFKNISQSLSQKEKELEEAKQLVFDLFNQSCLSGYDHKTNTPTFDHMCLSAYESAQDQLLSWGLIKPENCSRK